MCMDGIICISKRLHQTPAQLTPRGPGECHHIRNCFCTSDILRRKRGYCADKLSVLKVNLPNGMVTVYTYYYVNCPVSRLYILCLEVSQQLFIQFFFFF